MPERLALLSFDVEEFDLPNEYGQDFPEERQLAFPVPGLVAVLDLLDKTNARATLFTTAKFALAHPDLIRRAAGRHEIASHGFSHSTFEDADLARSREALADITGREVVGFRRARMAPTDPGAIRAAGYRYDSSTNPTLIPGRYNNLGRPRTPYRDEHGLVHVPVSVTPIVRFPLFWLSFKNLPLWINRIAASRCLSADGAVNLYFHPWEFQSIDEFTNVPGYIRRRSGRVMLERLANHIAWLSTRAKFATFAEYVATLNL